MRRHIHRLDDQLFRTVAAILPERVLEGLAEGEARFPPIPPEVRALLGNGQEFRRWLERLGADLCEKLYAEMGPFLPVFVLRAALPLYVGAREVLAGKGMARIGLISTARDEHGVPRLVSCKLPPSGNLPVVLFDVVAARGDTLASCVDALYQQHRTPVDLAVVFLTRRALGTLLPKLLPGKGRLHALYLTSNYPVLAALRDTGDLLFGPVE
ncbi:MAG: hypothetical protein A2284_06000 [Deltaproteobacteria bacterium RIFOXYA12_FULL_61_11]|nr:MAG: hypothetical protein A2284_06000 [Deltaproteobacteria bacterium RIFOXYA12_FULL_61_11]